MPRVVVFAALLAIATTAPVGAQEAASPVCEAERGARGVDARGVDVRGVVAVHCITAPAFAAWMEAAHASAAVGFYGAVPAAWAGAALRGGPYADAYRLTLAQGAAFVAMAGLKRLIRRPRPYVVVPGLVSRSGAYHAARAAPSFAMPSGHATLAAVIATSWSLSHPRWYVVAPGAAWAASVSLSRLWRGVHYPTDVLAGTLLGAGVGVLVHVAGPSLTPGFLEGDDAPPIVAVTLRF